MNSIPRIAAALLALCLGASAAAQTAKAPALALKGYDPVSYFDPGKPAKGASSIAYDFDDARYLFTSAKHKEAFAANPDRYAPQFTGLCTTGVSLGMKTAADPNVFLVRDGKLYIFSSTEARTMVEKDPTILEKAHGAWKAKR